MLPGWNGFSSYIMKNPKPRAAKGIGGIVDENSRVLKHDENRAVRDAAIIAGAQKVEHYEIASYGSVRAWAEQMGHPVALILIDVVMHSAFYQTTLDVLLRHLTCDFTYSRGSGHE